MRTCSAPRSVVAALVASSLLVACGDVTSPTASPETTARPVPTTAAPIWPTTTESANAGAVSDDDLVAARDAAVGFVTALGRGDLTTAASLIGPASKERTGGAEVLQSMLRASTEGHGAWVSATDRVVTPIATMPDLVAVRLEGTLQIEGMSEHRVEVFPVRRATPSGAWLVEPWAWDFLGEPPFAILSPVVDVEERTAARGNLTVDIRSSEGGTVAVSFDGAPVETVDMHAGDGQVFVPSTDQARTVTVLFASGATVAASGFVVDRAASSPIGE